MRTLSTFITSFPNGSGGGPDGLLPQHLKDLTGSSAWDGCVSLLTSLGGLLSLIQEGRTPSHIHLLFFGANLTALTMKSSGICPIAVGCTLRRLAAKCTCLHALESTPALLYPHQLGFGIPGGADAAVNAARIYLSQMPNNKALLKVDFRNAFNSIRRDKMLEAVEACIPELLPFVHSAYSAPSILLWNEIQILSSEGIQQGDPLGPLLFCLTIHELLSILVSEFKVSFLDDGTMGGDLDDLTTDLKRINEEGQALGLILNVSKSELISHDQSKLGIMFSIFQVLVFVDPTLLGSPLGPN